MLIQLLISLLLPLVTLGEAVYTAPPLIGVFSHPLGSSSQYIAKSYISWINSGGGRAVPISYYATAEEITTLYGTLNGFLFPGGSAALPESARFLYAKLTSTNDVEDPQQKPVLWGTCLGFEWISLLAGAPTLDSFQAENISLPLQFEQSAFTSRLFTNDDKSDNKKIQNIFANQNVTMNNHHKGIAPSRFQNTSTSLNTSYRLLSISYDKMGQSFVSSMEHMDLPIYGVQFHPEKNNFEYGVAVPAKRARTTAAVGGKISEIHNKGLFSKEKYTKKIRSVDTTSHFDIQFYEAINHSPSAILASQFLASKLVDQARKSATTKYRNPIFNTGKVIMIDYYTNTLSKELAPGFEEVYVFPKSYQSMAHTALEREFQMEL